MVTYLTSQLRWNLRTTNQLSVVLARDHSRSSISTAWFLNRLVRATSTMARKNGDVRIKYGRNLLLHQRFGSRLIVKSFIAI